ncbi:hemerythrin domain-containing protein [Noviherbaspirillum sp. CPCC 100848]|uniref:Hemerythrin domain-containing protein n=1 Tax=Noviherbaspirillum album TaxID=3080276 RepID=A0ABU6J4I8_9BURK|nr:hemerythrin domain-containing protein [Noviherbaspirillum sp. CPCC 100848]MEC4718537.1 hemerythrin domain-containing protein [Noviherbaspirillum sp. CPCC 100848]
MNKDANAFRRGEFPTDAPIEALRTDHRFVKELFERYFATRDEGEKKETGRHVLLLLEMHTSLEEGVFYPRVRDADPRLVDHCEEEHEEARQLIDRLKPMDESDPQAEQLFRQLADMIMLHVEEEETTLFPKVEQAGLDLSAIGMEMQALQMRMIADRMQKPVAPGLRQ